MPWVIVPTCMLPRGYPSVSDMLTPGDLRRSPRPIKVYEEADLTYETYLVGSACYASSSVDQATQNDHLIANEPFILVNQQLDYEKEVVPIRKNFWHPLNGSVFRLNRVVRSAGSLSPDSTRRAGIFGTLRAYAGGSKTVPVADLKTYSPSDGQIDVTQLKLEDVIKAWKNNTVKGEKYYIKDWHLQREQEIKGMSVEYIYRVPKILWGRLSSFSCAYAEVCQDDWLNPPFAESSARATGDEAKAKVDDFRFCYAGPPYTFTPVHRDVYGSYSWSYNVQGRKLWYLIPPGSYDPSKPLNVWDWPDEGTSLMRVLQMEGETIFVPSGWYHQVVNLDWVSLSPRRGNQLRMQTVSLNHNFFSSVSLPRIYDTTLASQEEVTALILDVKEMIQQRVGIDGPWEREWLEEVQELLRRDAGWGWKGFWQTVLHNLNVRSFPFGPRGSALKVAEGAAGPT